MSYSAKKYADLIGLDKISLFNHIVGKNAFDLIIKKIDDQSDTNKSVIFSTNKVLKGVLGNEELNKSGLILFRILSAEACIKRRREFLSYKDDQVQLLLLENGAIVIENFLDNSVFEQIEEKIMNEKTIENLPGYYNGKTGWNGHYNINHEIMGGLEAGSARTTALLQTGRTWEALDSLEALAEKYILDLECVKLILENFYQNKALGAIVGNFLGVNEFSYSHQHLEKLKHVLPDPQTDTHIDTFFSAIKFWLFLHDVESCHGPFAYSFGSHKNTLEKMEWEYKQSVFISNPQNRSKERRKVTGKSHAEGSFRISEKVLERELKFAKTSPIYVKKNSLVIQNNRGFHRRSIGDPNSHRIGLFGDLRTNPFLIP